MAQSKQITNSQRKYIYALLKNTGLEHQRDNLVDGFTKTGSMKNMSSLEADAMIKHLESEKYKNIKPQKDKLVKRRRYLISLCYDMPKKFNFWTSISENKQKFNAKGLDEWLLNGKKSPFKKRLNDLNGKELSIMISIFQKFNKFYENRNSDRS